MHYKADHEFQYRWVDKFLDNKVSVQSLDSPELEVSLDSFIRWQKLLFGLRINRQFHSFRVSNFFVMSIIDQAKAAIMLPFLCPYLRVLQHISPVLSYRFLLPLKAVKFALPNIIATYTFLVLSEWYNSGKFSKQEKRLPG